MLGKRHSKLRLAAGGIVLVSWCMSSIANAAERTRMSGFILTSTTFKDGGMLPARAAASGPCNGDNISPQLSWAKPPAGTKSYAITEVTEEGGNREGDVNMVVYGIPASVTSVAVGELSKPSPNYVGGKNRFGQNIWRGMCAPPGAAPHHYVIKIIATDLDPKELPPGLTYEEMRARIKGHAKDSAVLVGLYVNP